MKKAMQDPAAELSQEDSALWLELFAILQKDKELTAKLLYLRGVGCRLVEQGRSYKIVPIIDPSGMARAPAARMRSLQARKAINLFRIATL